MRAIMRYDKEEEVKTCGKENERRHQVRADERECIHRYIVIYFYNLSANVEDSEHTWVTVVMVIRERS